MKKNNTLSELTEALKGLRELETLLHVGLKRGQMKGKIDLLMGCNNGGIDKYASTIEALLKNHWPSGSFFVCDDSLRFDLSIGTGGVAICDSTLLSQQIKEWTEGKNLDGRHKSWAIGYWLPEALCGDLATSEILFDTKKIGIQIKKLVSTYPSHLSKLIVDLCIDEIQQKIQILSMLLEKNSPIELGLCISDITASITRLAFARSKVYFRGFRSLNTQTKLLKSSDRSLYELARNLSQRKEIASLVIKIKKLL